MKTFPLALAAVLALAATTAATAMDPYAMTSRVEPTYSNSADFLRYEGATCRGATDGCNSMTVSSGALGISTMMYCADVYAGNERWQCTRRAGELSADDKTKYASAWVSAGYDGQAAVRAFVAAYKARADMLSTADAASLRANVTVRADAIITMMFERYSQETVEASKAYAALRLVKFELEVLN